MGDCESLLELVIREAVGDHRGDVEPGLGEYRHLVPRLEDLAAVNALYGEHLEHDLRPVDRELVVREAQHGDSSAVRHVRDHVAQRTRLAGHLEADVESLLHAELLLDLGKGGGADVHRTRHADLAGELQAVVADIGDDDVTRADVTRHQRGHDPDRTRAGDQHVLRDDPKLGRRVNGIAEWVEYRSNVEVDFGEVGPQVDRRHHDQLGEGAVALDSDADRVGAERAPAGQAIAAAPANDMSLGSDDLARLNRRDTFAQPNHLADELVANHQRRMDRRLGPFVPALDVQIGAADARAQDADQHLAGTRRRIGYVPQPQARRRLRFDQRLHCGQDIVLPRPSP